MVWTFNIPNLDYSIKQSSYFENKDIGIKKTESVAKSQFPRVWGKIFVPLLRNNGKKENWKHFNQIIKSIFDITFDCDRRSKVQKIQRTKKATKLKKWILNFTSPPARIYHNITINQ